MPNITDCNGQLLYKCWLHEICIWHFMSMLISFFLCETNANLFIACFNIVLGHILLELLWLYSCSSTVYNQMEDWFVLFHSTSIWLLLHRVGNIIITANDTDEPPTVSPPSEPLHPDATWPTPSGIDEDEARRICESPILESPIYSLCQNYTEQSLEFISESCMLDLLVWKLTFAC